MASPGASERATVADNLLPTPPESKPRVEYDGRVSLPARWVEHGEFGTIRIRHEDYGKWHKKHYVNGHWYAWNGLFFEWCMSPHQLPVPTILPDGEHYFAELAFWYPGDPLPKWYRRSIDSVTYVYDKYRDAYVRSGHECKGTPGSALRGMLVGLALTATIFLWFIGVPVFVYSLVVLILRLFEEPPTRLNAYPRRSNHDGASVPA
jgi:hypothetical protein